MNKINKKNLNRTIILIFIFKLLLALFFDSEINKAQILPFIDHFLLNFYNPYEYFAHCPTSFNYSPLMLYILAIFRAPYTLFFSNNVLIENFLFKIPLFISDFAILFTLFSLFPARKKETVFFYFLNPIIIYSSFIQSQLDLMPTALIFISTALLLKHEIRKSFLFLSCAVALNFYAILSIPITIIYLLMHTKKRRIVELLVILISTNILFVLPVIFNDGFVRMFLLFSMKTFITDSFIYIGEMKLYLTLIGICLVYAALLRQKKINQDLLFSFYGMLFSVFVLLEYQEPGGYIWFVPFLVCYFINYMSPDKNNVYFYLAFSLCYLIYYVLFDGLANLNIKYLNNTIGYSRFTGSDRLANFFFTILDSLVCINIYIFYKYAMNSNNFYRNKQILSFGIGGDSGSGKSKLLMDLKGMFKNKLLDLEGDGDHKWERGNRQWDKITHLNPKANYIYEQANNIKLLKEGKSIYRKEYNHTDGTFTEKFKVHPRDYIVLCGLHPFYLPKSRKIFDLKIFMDTDDKLRKHWKIIRDKKTRGYCNQNILKQIEDRKIDSIKYIHPQKKYADFIIHYFSDDNYQIGDMDANPSIKLKVVFDANLQIEELVNVLSKNGIDLEWDYLNNLEMQYLILHNKPDEQSVSYFKDYLLNHVVNIDELIDVNMDVQWGYRGVIQMLILKIVSLRLKATRS